MITSRQKALRSLALGGALATVAAFAWAQQSDDLLIIDQPVDHDVYAASRTVDVQSTIGGDLVAAGARVTINGNVSSDIIVAAQEVEIRSEVGDDVRAAGQLVRIMSPVSGHIVAAGQNVTVAQDVGDWAWLAGNTVEVLGDVGGDLKIRASEITINAEVAGNVELIGDALSLGPDARVRGNLVWRSANEANIDPGAQIEGEFIKKPPQDLADGLGTSRGIFFTLNLIAAIMILFLLFSGPLRTSADLVATRPGMSLLFGFAVFIATPLLVILLFVTGIAVWLGLFVLVLYLVVLLLGVLTGLYTASNLALRKLRPDPAVWHSLAAIFVTVVTVGFLAKVPWLGFLIVIVIWLLGVGALCWTAWTTLRDFGHKKPQPS